MQGNTGGRLSAGAAGAPDFSRIDVAGAGAAHTAGVPGAAVLAAAPAELLRGGSQSRLVPSAGRESFEIKSHPGSAQNRHAASAASTQVSAGDTQSVAPSDKNVALERTALGVGYSATVTQGFFLAMCFVNQLLNRWDWSIFDVGDLSTFGDFIALALRLFVVITVSYMGYRAKSDLTFVYLIPVAYGLVKAYKQVWEACLDFGDAVTHRDRWNCPGFQAGLIVFAYHATNCILALNKAIVFSGLGMLGCDDLSEQLLTISEGGLFWALSQFFSWLTVKLLAALPIFLINIVALPAIQEMFYLKYVRPAWYKLCVWAGSRHAKAMERRRACIVDHIESQRQDLVAAWKTYARSIKRKRGTDDGRLDANRLAHVIATLANASTIGDTPFDAQVLKTILMAGDTARGLSEAEATRLRNAVKVGKRDKLTVRHMVNIDRRVMGVELKRETPGERRWIYVFCIVAVATNYLSRWNMLNVTRIAFEHVGLSAWVGMGSALFWVSATALTFNQCWGGARSVVDEVMGYRPGMKHNIDATLEFNLRFPFCKPCKRVSIPLPCLSGQTYLALFSIVAGFLSATPNAESNRKAMLEGDVSLTSAFGQILMVCSFLGQISVDSPAVFGVRKAIAERRVTQPKQDDGEENPEYDRVYSVVRVFHDQLQSARMRIESASQMYVETCAAPSAVLAA